MKNKEKQGMKKQYRIRKKKRNRSILKVRKREEGNKGNKCKWIRNEGRNNKLIIQIIVTSTLKPK